MKLMVSEDCGVSYYEEMRAETLEPLQARAEELRLDERMLRWVIESDDGSDILEASAIQKAILAGVMLAREAEVSKKRGDL